MSEADGHVENIITGGIFLQTVIQGRDVTVQLPPQITPALSGLPAPSPAFTGRDEHIGTLLKDLAPKKPRKPEQTSEQRLEQEQRAVLVSAVAGLGGIGKTELVIHAATQALRRPGWFPGGVLFIDLFGYDSALRLSPERALESLLRALAVPGAHIPAALEDRQRLYRTVLAHYAQEGRRILVVVDNASSVEQARPLLPTDGVTAALVTSRHTLDGLDARLHDLDALDEAASVALLGQALRLARGDHDTRITDDPVAAGEIARLCAGLPLALRIAAALLAASPTRPVASLAGTLRAEHSRLDKLSRADRAVRAAFDLSYQLLDDEHESLFRLLSLHPGPDVSSVAASHLSGTDPDRAEELLQHLADAHLVEPGQVWGRWRTHDLVRLYAREKIEDQAERQAALERLFDHYRHFSRNAASAVISGRFGEVFSTRDSALDWFDTERESLIASVFLAHEEDFLDYAAELPHRLARYLDLRRLFTDWEATMRISHAVLDGSGYVEFEAGALDSLGMVARELHRYSDSVAHHRRAVAQAREAEDEKLLARFLNNMGLALFQLRSYDEALAAHDEAADIFQRLDDHLGFARAIDNSASALRELGILDEALQRHEKAIAECEKRGAVETAARISTHLGNTLHDMGRYTDAVTAHKESVAALKKLRLPNETAHALNNLANSLRGAGRLDEAVLAVNESVELFALPDDRIGRARALNQAGLIHMARQEHEVAEERLKEALEVLQGTPDSIDAAYAHTNLGRLYALTGRPEPGMEELGIAARLFSALES